MDETFLNQTLQMQYRQRKIFIFCLILLPSPFSFFLFLTVRAEEAVLGESTLSVIGADMEGLAVQQLSDILYWTFKKKVLRKLFVEMNLNLT